mmetsp:Transcript_22646/g.56107  ORF Transcript_22646/g.56107 Transcript_22646/m.56107 type:complete len:270 (+) Transcript_22646:186-995(+)
MVPRIPRMMVTTRMTMKSSSGKCDTAVVRLRSSSSVPARACGMSILVSKRMYAHAAALAAAGGNPTAAAAPLELSPTLKTVCLLCIPALPLPIPSLPTSLLSLPLLPPASPPSPPSPVLPPLGLRRSLRLSCRSRSFFDAGDSCAFLRRIFLALPAPLSPRLISVMITPASPTASATFSSQRPANAITSHATLSHCSREISFDCPKSSSRSFPDAASMMMFPGCGSLLKHRSTNICCPSACSSAVTVRLHSAGGGSVLGSPHRVTSVIT